MNRVPKEMTGMDRSRLVIFCLIAIVVSCTRAPKLELTDQDLVLSLDHGGHTRHFIIHLPEHFKGVKDLPVVIALHGGGGTPKGMIRLTHGRFNELADRENFLVVYPEGLGKGWNDGRPDPISFAHKNNIDDIGFLSKLIKRLIKEYKADPKRIFATGISNGGFMSFRISRDLADQVKAVVPVCATIPLATKDAHLKSPPMNVMLINGTADPLVPYDGGEVKVLARKRGKIISTDETVKIFIKRNDCPDKPQVTKLKDQDPDDGTSAVRYEYTNYKTNNKVVLLKVTGGGHTWPGGWQYMRERFIGRTSRDFNGCDEIWSFFNSLE